MGQAEVFLEHLCFIPYSCCSLRINSVLLVSSILPFENPCVPNCFYHFATVNLSMKEGTIPLNIPSIDIPCYTYYKIIGALSNGSPPVVIVHGGPGAGLEYPLPFADLWPRYGLPVILYDQIGCRSSMHL